MSGSLRFDGKVAIVTGAGRGLGREYALQLARRGAKVVVNDLGEVAGWKFNAKEVKKVPVAEEVVAEIRAAGGHAVANLDSVLDGEKIVQTALEAYGQVDIVVCNAGTAHASPIEHVSDEALEFQMAVHVKGAYKVCVAAWPHMKKRRYGRIVLTSSPAGLYGIALTAPYSTAKAALIGLANVLTLEGKRLGIAANCIAPYAATRLTTAGIGKDKQRFKEDFERSLHPGLVAPMVAYLCHESCQERGVTFEAGGGWFSKVRLQRSRGIVLPDTPVVDDSLIEVVRDRFRDIDDFTDAEVVGPGSTMDIGKMIQKHRPAKL